MAWPAERDEVVQADGASALLNRRDVVNLETLAGSAAPVAVAVPLTGCCSCLLPSATVAHPSRLNWLLDAFCFARAQRFAGSRRMDPGEGIAGRVTPERGQRRARTTALAPVRPS